jgi:hypothetical protein
MEPNQNFDQAYTSAPEPTGEELIREMREIEARKRERMDHLVAVAEEAEAAEVSPGFFESRSGNNDGFVRDTLQVVATGLTDAAEGILNLPGDLGASFGSPDDLVFGIGPGDQVTGVPIPFTDNVKLGFGRRGEQLRIGNRIELPRATDRPDSAAGEMAASVVQFLVPFTQALKLAKSAEMGVFSGGALAGALTDFAVFDPYEGRLSNLLTELGKDNPVFDNTVTQWLASTDSALDGRMKNAIEGLGLGVLGDALFTGVKWLKAYRFEKAYNEAGNVASPDFRVPDTTAPVGVRLDDIVSSGSRDLVEPEQLRLFDFDNAPPAVVRAVEESDAQKWLDFDLDDLELPEPPKNTVKAYKLFRTDPRKPGELFPLFVNADKSIPTGRWYKAEVGPPDGDGVKSKIGRLAFRPGWHSGDLPVATHIGEYSPDRIAARSTVEAQRKAYLKQAGFDPDAKGKKPPGYKEAAKAAARAYPYPKGASAPDVRPDNQVWAEVDVPADRDWQEEALKRAERNKKGQVIPRTAHITDQIPEGGFYRYKTNSNMTGEWLISGAIKVNRVLTDDEVIEINAKAGVADLPRRPKVDPDLDPSLPTMEVEELTGAAAVAAVRDLPPASIAEIGEMTRVYNGYSEVPDRFYTSSALWKALRLAERNPDTLRGNVREIAIQLVEVRNKQAAAKAPPFSERGYEIVVEKMMAGVRRGELEPQTADFAMWLLEKNRNLATGLGISVRQGEGAYAGARGAYDAADEIMTLIKFRAGDGTAVHEMLHHSERLMPPAVQQKIREAWASALETAMAKATPEQQRALVQIMKAVQTGKASDKADAMAFFRDRTLNMDDHYHLLNPSEFWAVKGTEILKARYAADSWQAQAKQWLSEFVEKIKSLFGMDSDAEIIRGLEAILKSDGQRLSPDMLRQNARDLFRDPDLPRPDDPQMRSASEVSTPEQRIKRTIREEFRLKDGTSLDALTRAIRDGNIDEFGEITLFNPDRIDWANMEDGDAVAALIAAFEEVISPLVQKATGGVQSLKATARIGQLVGYSAEEAHKLYATARGEGGLAARMFAAHQAQLASARQMNKLAQKAQQTQAPADLFALHKHVELHAAIMASTKGAQTEIARALGAMRLFKSASADSFREFNEIKRTLGKHGNTDAIIDQILRARNLDQINVTVTRTTGRRIADVITELAINGMLSSIKTHVINLSSNALQVVVGTFDRYAAVGVGRLSGAADRATLREANAATAAMLNSITAASRLAVQAFKEGVPISDMRQRIEFDARKAIYMSPDGREGMDLAVAQTINMFGNFIRIPGRFLVAGDEFFKTLAKNAESAAQAYRMASKEADKVKHKTPAAREKWMKKRMAELISEPTVEMEAKVLEHMRRQTFQETPQTKFGPAVENLMNFHPLWKLLIAPFVRTPMNLLRQAFVDRNPVLFAVMQRNREVLARGGPEAHMVVARTVVGTGFMATALGLVGAGLVTGKGASFTNTEKMDGIPEYSFKVGNRYVTYNRLDPIGSMFGLMADLHYAMTTGFDSTDQNSQNMLLEFSQAVVMAFSQNALNKTWAQSLTDLMETLSIVSEGSDAVAERAMDKFVADQTGKLVPYSSFLRGVGQSIDPVVREAWNIRDRLYRSLPGLSSTLPPQRDLLGREVTRQNAEWFWANPFGANPASSNPVDLELARLAFDSQMLPKNLAEGVQLTPAQYSELKRLIGDLGRGPTFEEQLGTLFQSEQYQRMSDAVKVIAVKDMLRGRRQAAVGVLLMNDESLMKQLKDNRMTLKDVLLGNDTL